MFEGGISSYICECPAKNPTTDQIQTWHEARPGVLGATETNKQFGSQLNAGDFNSDGYADLAISIGNENNSKGEINIIYGDENGLSALNNKVIKSDREVRNTRFGSYLNVSDFNGDGTDDLAVSQLSDPRHTSETGRQGTVHVFLGSESGIDISSRTVHWNRISNN